MPAQPINLSSTSYVVLGLIEWRGESTPYDLKQYIERSVENFWPVPHATFYAEPDRLAGAGHLSMRREESGRRRKLYSITDAGRSVLHEWIASEEAAPPQLRDEGLLKLFFGADPVPIAKQHVEWHRQKLEELEGYLKAVRDAGGPAGVERTLVAGTAYNRAVADLWRTILE